MAGVNLKIVQRERSDQDNEEDGGSPDWELQQRVIQQHSSPKRGKSLKKQKTKKRRCTSFSFLFRYPPRRRKKESKK